MRAATTRSSWARCWNSTGRRRRLCFSTAGGSGAVIPTRRSRPRRILTFGSTAGDCGRRLVALEMLLSDFGERALRIQDELASDKLRGLERVGIDNQEQDIVDEADERGVVFV